MTPLTTLATLKMYPVPLVRPVTVAVVAVVLVFEDHWVQFVPPSVEYWMAYPVGAAGTWTNASS